MHPEKPDIKVSLQHLEQVLCAERSATMHEMQRRHKALLLQLELQPSPAWAVEKHPQNNKQVSQAKVTQCSDGSNEATKSECDHRNTVTVELDRPDKEDVDDESSRGIRNARSSMAKTVSRAGSYVVQRLISSTPRMLQSTISDAERRAWDVHNARGPWYVYLRVRQFMYGVTLEIVLAFLIVLSAGVVALESQYRSFDTLHMLSTQGVWPGQSSSATDVWPGADDAFFVIEFFFGIVFTLEVVLKVTVDPKQFVQSRWNIFDTLIMSFWLVSQVKDSLNPVFLRPLRIIKVIRLLRLAKTIQVFDGLHIIVGALRSSWSVFLASVLLLFTIMGLGALVANYALEDFIKDEGNPPLARKLVFQRYGNFARALVTMFEVTLGNFFPPIELLREEVSEWYALPFLLYICSVNFAMVQVIRGVFLSETMKVSSLDEDMMIMEKERQVTKHAADMERFFAEADDSGDGYLSFHEFESMTADPRVKLWLGAMNFEVHDVKVVFELLDDGDGLLSAEELVHGVARLKGFARSLDMIALHRRCDYIDRACNQMMNWLSNQGSVSGVALEPANPREKKSRGKGFTRTKSALFGMCRQGTKALTQSGQIAEPPLTEGIGHPSLSGTRGNGHVSPSASHNSVSTDNLRQFTPPRWRVDATKKPQVDPIQKPQVDSVQKSQVAPPSTRQCI